MNAAALAAAAAQLPVVNPCSNDFPFVYIVDLFFVYLLHEKS
jgi:hypothetical protein